VWRQCSLRRCRSLCRGRKWFGCWRTRSCRLRWRVLPVEGRRSGTCLWTRGVGNVRPAQLRVRVAWLYPWVWI